MSILSVIKNGMAAAARAGIQSAVKVADGISIASHLSPNQVEEIDADKLEGTFTLEGA